MCSRKCSVGDSSTRAACGWQAEEVRSRARGREERERGRERERERGREQGALHPQPHYTGVSSTERPPASAPPPASHSERNGHGLGVKTRPSSCHPEHILPLLSIMMEYWKQCALWLINCKVLPANHRVTWESAQVFDLAQTLRDGVLLCHLLNNLRAQAINLKEINLRPQMSQVRGETLTHEDKKNNPSLRNYNPPMQCGTRPRWDYSSLQYMLFFCKPALLLQHQWMSVWTIIAIFWIRDDNSH